MIRQAAEVALLVDHSNSIVKLSSSWWILAILITL
jgi:hypothetical protein